MTAFWGAWRKVSHDRASTDPKFGFGGWIWFFYGFALVRTLLAMRNIFGNEAALGGMYGLENVATIRIQLILRILLLLPFLLLAPLRHSLMPPVAIAGVWMTAVLALLFGLIVSLPEDRLLSVLVVEVLVASAYTLYLLRSKRVNVTYLSLIPSKA